MTKVKHWLIPLSVGVIAAVLFSVRLSIPPEFDELYHLLAARSYLTTGQLAIAEGIYDRGAAFTIFISYLMNYFGDSIIVARLPSLFSFVFITIGLFIWLNGYFDRATGLIASVLFMTSPFIIDLSVYTRFYGLQCLFFFLGVLLVEQIKPIGQSRCRIVTHAALATLLFLSALYLQIVTAIGIAGLSVWFGFRIVIPWLFNLRPSFRYSLIILAPALLILTLYQFGFLTEIVDRFRYTPAYFARSANEIWFYHFWFVLYYPTLWTLFPIIFVVAFFRDSRITGLCGAIFITAFFLHSLAGMKSIRYISYSLPFVYALFSIGIVGIWRKFRPIFHEYWANYVGSLSSKMSSRMAENLVLSAFLIFLILSNAASVRSLMMLSGLRIAPQPPLANWDAAGELLNKRLESAEIVLTTSELHALFYLGRYDVLISQSRMTELSEQHDFARDSRTGRPVIASAEAVENLIRCTASGILVTDGDRWRSGSRLSDAIANVFVREAVPIPMPAVWSMIAYEWTHDLPALKDKACEKVISDSLTKDLVKDK